MKALKFDHQAAQDILAGKRTVTWRINDDKHVAVNDTFIIIDKVDPLEPTTWQEVGRAQVTQIVEKQISAISLEDFADEGNYKSKEDLLNAFQKYYGANVTVDMPVKIIHFSLQAEQKDYPVEPRQKYDVLKLYTDGGSRGNPGPSASGYVIYDVDGNVVKKSGKYLGITTNNQAEYQAVLMGMEECLKLGAHEVQLFMDSLLVVNQMLGIYKIRNRDLWPIHEAIKNLSTQFAKVSFTHVMREYNKAADAMVNQILDEAAKS